MENIVLSNDDIKKLIQNKIINPFVPNNPNGITPIYVLNKNYNLKNILEGEGGLGSGKELDVDEYGTKDDPTEARKIRRREQIKNAQRKYRESKRSKYNQDQLNIYRKMVEEDGERYKNWKEKMITANKRYREKKQMERIQNIENDKTIQKKIDVKLKNEWKEKNKGKRGRPKKGEVKQKIEMDKDWYENRKKEEENKIKKELNEVIIKKKVKKVQLDEKGNPTGKMSHQIENKEDLVTDLVYPYFGDKDYDYSKSEFVPTKTTTYKKEDYIKYTTEPKQALKKVKKTAKKEELVEEKPDTKKKEKKSISELSEMEIADLFTKEENIQTTLTKSKLPTIFMNNKFNAWYEKNKDRKI
jgi:hypothetical protein